MSTTNNELKQRVEDEMYLLMEELVRDMRTKLRDGELTPSEFSAAVRMLKDNNVNVEITEGNIPKALRDEMEAELPFDELGEYRERQTA